MSATAAGLSGWIEVRRQAVDDGLARFLPAEGDGPSAIRTCMESPPAMVLTDIRLPGMDGLELIARLRELDGLDKVPIIALTSLAMPGDEELCRKAGANAYLAKPIKLKKLGKLLDEFMRES